MTHTPPTREQLRQAEPALRAGIVQDYAVDLIEAQRQPGSPPVDPTARLADLGVDSLQAVELKYSLDELLGHESDVDLFISNPTLQVLAEEMVRRANL
jgi:acyl carrier protein